MMVGAASPLRARPTLPKLRARAVRGGTRLISCEVLVERADLCAVLQPERAGEAGAIVGDDPVNGTDPTGQDGQ